MENEFGSTLGRESVGWLATRNIRQKAKLLSSSWSDTFVLATAFIWHLRTYCKWLLIYLKGIYRTIVAGLSAGCLPLKNPTCLVYNKPYVFMEVSFCLFDFHIIKTYVLIINWLGVKNQIIIHIWGNVLKMVFLYLFDNLIDF